MPRDSSNGRSDLGAFVRILFFFPLAQFQISGAQPIYSPQGRHTVCLRCTIAPMLLLFRHAGSLSAKLYRDSWSDEDGPRGSLSNRTLR
jgi:hypothetical protein